MREGKSVIRTIYDYDDLRKIYLDFWKVKTGSLIRMCVRELGEAAKQQRSDMLVGIRDTQI